MTRRGGMIGVALNTDGPNAVKKVVKSVVKSAE